MFYDSKGFLEHVNLLGEPKYESLHCTFAHFNQPGSEYRETPMKTPMAWRDFRMAERVTIPVHAGMVINLLIPGCAGTVIIDTRQQPPIARILRGENDLYIFEFTKEPSPCPEP